MTGIRKLKSIKERPKIESNLMKREYNIVLRNWQGFPVIPPKRPVLPKQLASASTPDRNPGQTAFGRSLYLEVFAKCVRSPHFPAQIEVLSLTNSEQLHKVRSIAFSYICPH